MNHLPRSLTLAFAALCIASLAHAERADRLKPAVLEYGETGKLDLKNDVVTLNGDVVITKGTMVIRAARVEFSKTPGGYDKAVAYGGSGKPATFRQKRDGVDEYMEGVANRLEYDGKSDTVRFIDNASVRRLRGATVADEVNGSLVTYDGTTELMSAAGGAVSASNPLGRTRIVMAPREGTEAATEAAESGASAPGLKTSPTLALPPAAKPGDKR